MSYFSIVKPSYLENTSNVIVNGNLTVNGTVSNYFDTSFKSFPENTYYTFGNLPNDGEKYQGGVLAPNGKIYCIPGKANDVLVIDPLTDTTTSIPLPNPDSNLWKFYGGVVAPNGKIYCIPSGATYVLIINPENNTIDTTTISGLSSQEAKWGGGVLAQNGLIFGVPRSQGSVLIINPVNNTIDTTTILLPSFINFGWLGGVLAPNGKIYCIPQYETRVLIINPITFTTDLTSITGLLGDDWHRSGVLAPNGKIYCSPTWNRVSIIDPVNNTVDQSTIVTPSSYNGSGFTLAPNGKIYSATLDVDYVTIIDPITNTVDISSISGLGGQFEKFYGSVLAPNGNIYFIPYNSSKVLVIRTGIPKLTNWIFKPNFNKF